MTRYTFLAISSGQKKEFLADKTKDLDYYVLALAAIARELNIRKMTCGKIRIAAGLPLTWVSGQRDEFRDYLMQNKAVDFSFRNVSYHVEIVGVDVFPQGFAAVADRLSDFRGVNMICDIGNGTMNIMFINDKKACSGISDGRLQSPRSVEQEKIEGEWRCWRTGRFTLGIAQTVRRR